MTLDRSHRAPDGARRRLTGRRTGPRLERHDGDFPAAARLLFTVVAGAAITAVVLVALADARVDQDWVAFAVLTALATLAQLFVVRTTHNQHLHLGIVFVLAAILLLPPELVALLCVLQHLPEWVRERYRWYIQGFNIANYVVAACAAWAATTPITDSPLPRGAAVALASIAASVVFVLVNHGILALMLRIARGHSLRESRLYSFESLSTDLVLALLGAVLAACWTANAWFVPLALAPLLLVHRSLKIPRLQAEARIDPKTGLYNARQLEASLDEELERARRFERPLAVIVADLDLLREINNRYGHLAGDAVLSGVADVFRSQLRPYDIAARFGGEEFAILLPETNAEQATEIAERIRTAVSETNFAPATTREPVRVTISLGLAVFPEDAADSEALLHRADVALYRSKALGRDRVSTWGAAEGGPATGGGPVVPRQPTATPLPTVADDPAPRLTVAPLHANPPATAAPTMRAGERRAREAIPAAVAVLISIVAVAATAIAAVTFPQLADTAVDEPGTLLLFACLAIALQLLAAEAHFVGGDSVSAIAIMATGFVLGPGPAVAVGVVAALTQWVRRRGAVHRAVFDAANIAISAATAASVYHLVAATTSSTPALLAGATGAGVVYKALNTGLLCRAISLSESTQFRAVWRERFRWARFHYVSFGPLAFATSLAYEELGLIGVMAFAVPPALMTLSMRQYLERTRASVAEVRQANLDLRHANARLAESNERVRRTHLATIAALSRSMEAKDHYTGGHTERVATVAVGLAARLGYSGSELEAIEIGALLHDVGKIGIPEHILHKAGPLDDEEWRIMRQHPLISDHILSGVDLHPYVRQIARWAHERVDGRGYPDGLAGEEIPLPARIVLVADAFDALTTDRVYRKGKRITAALEELRAHAGTQLCPVVVATLERIWRDEPELLDTRPQPARHVA